MNDKILKLKLERPIVFFDLETTGLNTSTDFIVSISALKIFINGTTEGKSTLINPERSIPAEASLVHGITNDMVKDAPTFKKISKSLHAFMSGCDIAGYNSNNFDVIMLNEEFARCNLNFPEEGTRMIDACTIFKKFEKRDLTTAYKFYCDKSLEDAHSSDADTLATYEVFLAQLEKYNELQDMSIQDLHNFCKMDNRVDIAGKIIQDDSGNYLYNFGQNKGQRIIDNPSYAEWMLSKDFATNTKAVLMRILTDCKKSKGEIPF